MKKLIAKIKGWWVGKQVYYVRVFLIGQSQPVSYFTLDSDLPFPGTFFQNGVVEKSELTPIS